MLYNYAAEDAEHYYEINSVIRQELLTMRSNPLEYGSYAQSNIIYLDVHNARKLAEQRYCIDLKRLTAIRSIKWRNYTLRLLASFEGLENGKQNGIVFVHIPFTVRNHNLISALGWSEYLDVQTKLYIEHLLMVSSSKKALLVCSDGTFCNTLTHEYLSDVELRFKLLDRYASFETELRTLQDARYTSHQFE